MRDEMLNWSVGSCDEFDARMQAMLDERRNPADDRSLGEHAVECSLCRDLLDLQSRVLVEWQDQATGAPAALEVELISGFDASGGERKWPQQVISRLAGVAAMLGIAWVSWQTLVTREAANPLSSDVTIVRMAEPVLPTMGLETAGSASSRVQLPGAFREASWPSIWSDWQLDWGWDVRHWLATDQPLDQSGPTWLRPVQGGIAPFANSVSSTLSVLRRTWPSTRSEGSTGEGGAKLDGFEEVSAERPS